MRGNVASEKVVAEFASHGPYALLVHNAATGVIKPALETEDKHWDWTLNANARALLSLTRACAPQMESGSSIVARLVASARSACSRTTCSSARRRRRSSRSCATSPSSLRRAGSASMPFRRASSRPRRSTTSRTGSRCSTQARARTPAGRIVEPDDVADAVAFLCSDDAKMVCGQTLIVDGGFSLARLMEPTDQNRRAWDEIHRRRTEAMLGELGLPTSGASCASPTSRASAC